MEDEKVLLTVDEAAHRLSIGRSHAYIFVMKGQLESVKIGKSRRVPANAIEDFIARLRRGEVEG